MYVFSPLIHAAVSRNRFEVMLIFVRFDRKNTPAKHLWTYESSLLRKKTLFICSIQFQFCIDHSIHYGGVRHLSSTSNSINHYLSVHSFQMFYCVCISFLNMTEINN